MATSGVRVLTRTRDDIIKGAFRLLGLIKAGGTVAHPEMISFAADALNEMITEFQADGVGLWLKLDVKLYLQKNEPSYSIGPTGDHCTASSVETTVDGAVDSGQSAIDVDSITGILDGDYLGVQLDTGFFQFTTVDGTPAGSTIALDDALTSDVDDGAFVFAYTNKVARPLSIESMRLVQEDDTELQLRIDSRDRYLAVNDKTEGGRPNFVYYHPQLTNGVLHVWQPTSDVTQRLKFTIKQPIELFTAGTDSVDFPQEWFNAIKYSLASYMGTEYLDVIDPNRYLIIQAKAIEYRDKMFGSDTEPTPLRFATVYTMRGRGR